MRMMVDLFTELFTEICMELGISVSISVWVWKLAIDRKSSQIGFMQGFGLKGWFIAVFASMAISAAVKLAYDTESMWSDIPAGLAPIGLVFLLFGDKEVSSLAVKGILSLPAGFAAIQGVQIIYHKCKGRRFKNFRKTMKRMLKKMVQIAVISFSVVSVLLVAADVKTTVVRTCMKQNGIAENITIVTEKVFSSNRSVLEKLEKENWCKAGIREREEACYELMQLYMLFLTGGIDESARLIVGNDFLEKAGGYYDYEGNFILLDQQYIGKDECYEYSLNAVAHETYHWFEYCVLDLGEEADMRNVIPDGHISQYDAEFRNYISVEEDEETYQEQYCEMDAQDFADAITMQLFEFME